MDDKRLNFHAARLDEIERFLDSHALPPQFGGSAPSVVVGSIDTYLETGIALAERELASLPLMSSKELMLKKRLIALKSKLIALRRRIVG